ncbi:MAG: ribonuclease E/G [Lachnospiraceae bacterium]|jgi:ribonuclease G|nr:ribonuclease E/G [Lachnospiraceae bacterium]
MYQIMISKLPEKIQAGILWEDQLIAYHEYVQENEEILGDIRLAQIEEIVPGINAVFLNIGEKRPAFMPIDQTTARNYKPGQECLVQLQKDAVGEKGMVVTDQLSLTGRYIVLTPANSKLGVSAKIADPKERARLKDIGSSFPQCGKIGYILRTDSQSKEELPLQQEALRLYQLYQKITEQAKYSRIGDTLYRAGSSVGKLILSLPVAKIGKIVVDDAALFKQIKEEILLQHSELESCFQLYQDSHWPLMDFYKISAQLPKALQKKVFLSHGGYLFVEETEALAVIDVNTGKAIAGRDKEIAVAQFNIQAVPYIVQQILLRNLAGIIMIDFIDMREIAHKNQLLAILQKTFSELDLHKTKVHGFTQLGLVEISRERKGKPLSRQFHI